MDMNGGSQAIPDEYGVQLAAISGDCHPVPLVAVPLEEIWHSVLPPAFLLCLLFSQVYSTISRCSFLLLTGLVNPEIESSINATKEKKKEKERKK